MLNCGGSSGSHLHLFGAHVTHFQHLLRHPLSRMRANRPCLSLPLIETDSLEPPSTIALVGLLSGRAVESGVFPNLGILFSFAMTGRKERRGFNVATVLALRVRYRKGRMTGRDDKRKSHGVLHGVDDQATPAVYSPFVTSDGLGERRPPRCVDRHHRSESAIEHYLIVTIT